MPQQTILTSSQSQIVRDLHRFRVICCGRRFGKTTLAIDEIKACAALRAGSRVAYIAPTFQQARDIAWQQLKADCKSAAEHINETRLEIKLVNGSLIILRGWESIETLRGQKFDLVVLDEVASMRNFWLHWQEVVRPTLTDTKGQAIFISTPKGFNHFYELFNLESGIGWEKGADPDFKSFHFTTYDNPHIPREEIDKARAQLGDTRFAQEYMADFKKTEGLVYKEFDRKVHIYTEEPHGIVEKIAGIDFGFTNPCAVIELWRDRSDCFWIEEEFYETHRTDSQVAEYVAAKGFNKVYPDPESPSAIEELRKRHVPIRDVVKGKDSIENGIRKVQDLLRAGKLKVNARCVNTIFEFETYAYPDKKPMHNENESPIDEHNHAMDALRYPIMMLTTNSSAARVYYPNHAPVLETPTQMVKMPMQGQGRVHYPKQQRRGVVFPN